MGAQGMRPYLSNLRTHFDIYIYIYTHFVYMYNA